MGGGGVDDNKKARPDGNGWQCMRKRNKAMKEQLWKGGEEKLSLND